MQIATRDRRESMKNVSRRNDSIDSEHEVSGDDRSVDLGSQGILIESSDKVASEKAMVEKISAVKTGSESVIDSLVGTSDQREDIVLRPEDNRLYDDINGIKYHARKTKRITFPLRQKTGTAESGSKFIILYSLLSSGIVGYSSKSREIVWRNEIDLQFSNHIQFNTIISRHVSPRSSYQTGTQNRMSDNKVLGIFVGQIDGDDPESIGDVLKISIFVRSSFDAIRHLLDITQEEVYESIYTSLGRAISYGGAVYTTSVTPERLAMIVATTSDKYDPLSRLLNEFEKAWEGLLRSPASCPLPDPPIETRDNRNSAYEISPTPAGGRRIMAMISEVLNDGVVFHISVTEDLIPGAMQWARKS